jgi:pilus assembly protein CpaF
MVNGPKNIYIERAGKIVRTTAQFESNDHVMRIIDRIVAPLGRRIDEASPYVDARLPDGSRVNAVIPPISPSVPRSPSVSSSRSLDGQARSSRTVPSRPNRSSS